MWDGDRKTGNMTVAPTKNRAPLRQPQHQRCRSLGTARPQPIGINPALLRKTDHPKNQASSISASAITTVPTKGPTINPSPHSHITHLSPASSTEETSSPSRGVSQPQNRASKTGGAPRGSSEPYPALIGGIVRSRRSALRPKPQPKPKRARWAQSQDIRRAQTGKRTKNRGGFRD
jgi:hypothetical protein